MNPDSSLRSELVRNLVRVNGAALFVQVWEWAITLDDEVEYIWSKPKSSWVKWVFLFLRYFTFVAQFVNRSVDMAVLYDFPLRPSAIKVYYIVGVVVAQLAMAGVETVMMVRVYALYGRSKYVKFSFIFLLFAGFATMIVGLVLNIPEDNFKPTSIMISAPASFAYFGVAALVSQVAILALSAMRWRPGSSAPVMRMFMFDGMLAFISISIRNIYSSRFNGAHDMYPSSIIIHRDQLRMAPVFGLVCGLPAHFEHTTTVATAISLRTDFLYPAVHDHVYSLVIALSNLTSVLLIFNAYLSSSNPNTRS
ncbi:hypothetical protein PC9H_007841 [Pleurotus ostreatus]|uniref:DUF6533 domain-containing protein n=1 Tax=Pleurotus ostreatus TaxID=5322 RepID=A0A8H7DS20_PLEOS|nr:uncharacterized protein PC9H_007841 [Pleurotus ostreatus]KAF7428614.1 hypothetical protein PC9H_007841 [Pleurotus ostreatus]